MRKIVFDGGPHTGKSTLLAALERIYPSAYFVPEPATTVIDEELAKRNEDPSYEPIMPIERYPEFYDLVIKRSLELEAAIPRSAELVFLDRSLSTNIGYAQLNSHTGKLGELIRHITEANYSLTFWCEFVGTYEKSRERREDQARAVMTHKAIRNGYSWLQNSLPATEYPPMVVLDNVPVEDRLVVIKDSLASVGLAP